MILAGAAAVLGACGGNSGAVKVEPSCEDVAARVAELSKIQAAWKVVRVDVRQR